MDGCKRAFRLWGRRLVLEFMLRSVQALVAVASAGRWRAWARNSLALGYWSENSDLDITLFSRKSAVPPAPVLWLWRLCRPYGEWAAFTGADKQWAKAADPLELARDPRLLRAFQAVPRACSPAEAFVFWLRMVGGRKWRELDLAKLKSRERKWSFHRRELERERGIRCIQPFPFCIEEMGALLSPIPRAEWTDCWPFFWPQQWLNEALQEGVVVREYLREGPPLLLEVARAQVRWEIWGLLGQIRLQKNVMDIQRHFSGLADLFPSDDPIRAEAASFQHYVDGQLALISAPT